jgi:hypothetical protein
MINFQKAFKIHKSFFKAVGRIVLKRHRANIFDKGLNAAGNKFLAYEPKYEKRKTAGQAAPRGRQQISKSAKPNLTLTGDLRKSFTHLKVSKDGFEYGIDDREMSDRMRYQGPEKKSRKRYVSTKTNPTTPDLQELIMRQMQSQLIKNFTKEIRKNGMGYKVYTI